MARSRYAQHGRLLVVDVEPPPVVVQGAEGAPPYRARCIRAGDRPPLVRGDTLVVTHVNPSGDLTVVERVAPGAREGTSTNAPNTSPRRGRPEARRVGRTLGDAGRLWYVSSRVRVGVT